ncbi:DUF960 domain-containing protein [Lentilactobacillus buchneri]|uniref:DUF960 domain-containing protein n=1 Tax=Lentilactobacillus buchneri TaxID=1581 RepID=UPI0021A29090|nr:DUF960 domain-containing protein [Lentilactobacillus buchneri]
MFFIKIIHDYFVSRQTLVNNDGNLSYDFIQGNELVATFDSPYPYDNGYPKSLVVYDSGDRQIIATPPEINL